MTHDSIGLGEDGPTHQPVEHLAALRAMPNLMVYRPADAVETAECWQLALHDRKRPSLIALTRQNLAPVRLAYVEENLCARGAYEVAAADGEARGEPVRHRLGGRHRDRGEDAARRSAALPPASSRCRASSASSSRMRPTAQRRIGTAPVRVGIEAAVRQGWDAIIGTDGIFVGMTGFGASGALRGPLPAFRHHRRGGGGAGDGAPRPGAREARRSRDLRRRG